MANATDYLEGKLIDHVLRATGYTSPTTIYMSLHSSTTTDAGGGTELSGLGYARQSVAFSASGATDGATSNSAEIRYTASGGTWSTVTHFALYDALTSGNMLIHGALTASKTPNDGDSIVFAIGDLDITVA